MAPPANHASRRLPKPARNIRFPVQTKADDGGTRPGGFHITNPGAAPFRQHSLHISFCQPLPGAEGGAKRFSEGVCGANFALRRHVSSKLSCVQSGFSTRAHAQRKDHANRQAKMNSRNPPNIATGLTHRQPDFRASHCRGRSPRQIEAREGQGQDGETKIPRPSRGISPAFAASLPPASGSAC
jgi:hypothetical protein